MAVDDVGWANLDDGLLRLLLIDIAHGLGQDHDPLVQFRALVPLSHHLLLLLERLVQLEYFNLLLSRGSGIVVRLLDHVNRGVPRRHLPVADLLLGVLTVADAVVVLDHERLLRLDPGHLVLVPLVRGVAGSVEVVGEGLDLDDVRGLRVLGRDLGSVGYAGVLLLKLDGLL